MECCLTVRTVGTAALTFAVTGCSEPTNHTSPYAGQESRKISSLSPDDIAELERGSGWGLAKAAELNGLPGPAHLLEMKDEIALSSSQVVQIEAVRDAMRIEAKTYGQQLIELERALDDGFKERKFTPETLENALDELGRVRTKLRFAHLAAHLQTPEILSEQQIEQYNQLRGYTTGGDPCANVPQGHNEAMWRKHNGCE